MLPSEAAQATIINTTGAQLVWGPFRLPGLLGIGVNIFTIAYLILVVFFSFWPPLTPVTAQNMNYAIVGTGGVTIFSIVYYLLVARKVYNGPRIETQY